MSSGQKAWAEEKEDEYHRAHLARLEALGYARIANKVDEIDDRLRQLQMGGLSLPRWAWAVLDRLETVVKELR